MNHTTRWWVFIALIIACGAANAEPVTTFMAAYGSYVAVATTILSTAYSAYSAKEQGKDQQAMYESRAGQLEEQAGQQRAAYQRRASEERRQSRLKLSRLQAVAGGGGADESVLGLTGEIAGEGEYNALVSMYEGEEAARGRELGAFNSRQEGAAARRAGSIAATNTVLSGASGLFSKYGNGGVGGGGGAGASFGENLDGFYRRSNRGSGD